MESSPSQLGGTSNQQLAALRAAAASDPETFKALSKAAIEARDLALLQRALALGGRPNDYVYDVLALRPPSREMLASLLDAGFDVDGRISGHRGVVLNAAAASAKADYVALLLERGADPNVVGPNATGPRCGEGGWLANSLGPLGAAVEGFMRQPPEAESCVVMEMLIDGGAKVAGSGALQVAATWNRLQCARLLIERGADVREAVPSVEKGRTPMQLAREMGYTDMIALLAEHGAE